MPVMTWFPDGFCEHAATSAHAETTENDNLTKYFSFIAFTFRQPG
jgi:hypothetical protein